MGTSLSKVLLHIFNLLVLLVFTSYNNACRCVYVCVVHTNELYYISAVLECVFALFDFTFFFKYCPLTNVMRMVCKHLCTFRVCVRFVYKSTPSRRPPAELKHIYVCVVNLCLIFMIKVFKQLNTLTVLIHNIAMRMCMCGLSRDLYGLQE